MDASKDSLSRRALDAEQLVPPQTLIHLLNEPVLAIASLFAASKSATLRIRPAANFSIT
jgi:hypothetical protein